MSRIITYLLNVDNLSLVHSTLEEKAGCKINNQDIFCITLTDGCASVNVKAVLWNNKKFNQDNAL